MATQLPDVKVTTVEAGGGFLVTCSGCPNLRVIHPGRPMADGFARKHRASHQQPRFEEDIL